MVTLFTNLLLVCYSVFITWIIAAILFKSFRQKKGPDESIKYPDLSVVIPFRNEEHNLKPLLSSLSQQNYPGNVEVVLVDDNSIDRSVEIIQENAPFCKFKTTLLTLDYNDSVNLTSKQQAVHKGILSAQNDAVVLTDADMIFETDWLSSLGEQLSNGADFVFGRSSIYNKGNSFFVRFQAYQLDFLFCIAGSFYHAGITGSCMGNNIALLRNKYISTGGYEKIGYSIVEDRALYALFKKNNLNCKMAEPFHSKAYTLPCRTIKQFHHQMLRWARGGFSINSILLPAGLLFAFQNIVLCLSITGLPALSSVYIAAGNFFLTWLLVSFSFQQIKVDSKAIYFPVFFCILMVESVFFAGSLLFYRQIDWKGRVVNK